MPAAEGSPHPQLDDQLVLGVRDVSSSILRFKVAFIVYLHYASTLLLVRVRAGLDRMRDQLVCV